MSRYLAAAMALSAALAASPAAAQTDDALLMAVMRNDPAAIDMAVRAGANPRAVGEQGSLLAQAALSGRARAVRALLANGADPAAPGPNGGNALNAAFFAMNGMVLMGRDDEPSPARRAEAVEIVRMIAARRTGLDSQMRIGPTMMTPLMQAAQAGALDLVRILLDAGANPNAANGGGYTALDYAADRAPGWSSFPAAERGEIVQALLAKGARRDRAGADRLTPLARARRAGNTAAAAALEAR
ncbi:MAG: ankyrin repeat domain-containing protein [Pseudomonadota bacterium]